MSTHKVCFREKIRKISGPSCSKLKMSLVNDSLKFTLSDTQICWNFLLKKCALATHIFSAKNIRIMFIESAKTVKEMTLNELVKLTMLWTTGPSTMWLSPPRWLSWMCVRLVVRRLQIWPMVGQQHSFMEIDHEIFSTVILSLLLIQEGWLSVSCKRMCTILVNCLED